MTQPKAKPKAKLNHDQKVELVVKSIEHFLRFGAIANGGGSIATISVISATAKDGDIINILALPLGLFLLGVLFCLLMSLKSFISSGRILKGASLTADKGFGWIEPLLSKYDDVLLTSPILFFAFGCLSGVFIIAFA